MEILPSGNVLITSEDKTERLLFYVEGLGFGCELLENDFTPGTDAWSNREIEIYEVIKKYS